MRTALVTGASDGIGEQAARALAKKGWQVAIIGRNPDKTRQVAQDLGALYYIADFASLRQVKSLAEQLLRDFPKIDLLANNAGGIFSKQPLTEDGFEKTFQVNYLAHYLLTRLLLPRLIACKAKVINTSSVAHRSIGLFFNLDTVDKPKRYFQHLAYGNSKLANILFTRELHRRTEGAGITTASFHPGIVATSFSKESKSPMRLVYHTALKKMMGMISPQEGADTLLFLAEGTPGKDWTPGEYYAKRALAKTSRKAKDPALAKALWEKSDQLCKPFLPFEEEQR